MAVCDAGLKAHSIDSGLPIVRNRPSILYQQPSDEHGVLEDKEDSLSLGDKLYLVPGHCDPTVNLHDCYVGVRNGFVESVWPVSARGMIFWADDPELRPVCWDHLNVSKLYTEVNRLAYFVARSEMALNLYFQTRDSFCVWFPISLLLNPPETATWQEKGHPVIFKTKRDICRKNFNCKSAVQAKPVNTHLLLNHLFVKYLNRLKKLSLFFTLFPYQQLRLLFKSGKIL